MDKKITPPGGANTGNEVSAKGNNCNSNHSTPLARTSTAAQRKTILTYLQTGRQLTTLHAREHMGIMHPAMRVKELRNQGHNIVTHWEIEVDVTGTRHRNACYALLSGKQEVAA